MFVEQYADLLIKLSVQEAEHFVLSDVDLDEHYRDELVVAFSLYEALNEDEKQAVKREAVNATVEDVLTIIAESNFDVFEALERLDASGAHVTDYLKRQLTRGRACLLVFDQLISEGKSYGAT